MQTDKTLRRRNTERVKSRLHTDMEYCEKNRLCFQKSTKENA